MRAALDAAENGRDLAHDRAKTMTLGTQGRIKCDVVSAGRKNLLDQPALGGEADMVGMLRRSPMTQETRSGGWLGPEQAAVFEPAQVLIAGVFAQGIHWSLAS